LDNLGARMFPVVVHGLHVFILHKFGKAEGFNLSTGGIRSLAVVVVRRIEVEWIEGHCRLLLPTKQMNQILQVYFPTPLCARIWLCLSRYLILLNHHLDARLSLFAVFSVSESCCENYQRPFVTWSATLNSSTTQCGAYCSLAEMHRK